MVALSVAASLGLNAAPMHERSLDAPKQEMEILFFPDDHSDPEFRQSLRFQLGALKLGGFKALGLECPPSDQQYVYSREVSSIPPEKLFDDPLWMLRDVIEDAISLGISVRCIDGESIIPFSDGYLSGSLDFASAQHLFQVREYEMASNILQLAEEFGKVAVLLGEAHTLDFPVVEVKFRAYKEPLRLTPVFYILSHILGEGSVWAVGGVVVVEDEGPKIRIFLDEK